MLQFDQGDQVRLIGFNNHSPPGDVSSTLAEVWMEASKFYALLEEWQSKFEAERVAALKQATKR